MSPKTLLEPILEHGIRNTNFFEGRLLSGKDLQDQQEANRTHHRHLGRAIGAGVIEGLEVEVKSDGSDNTPPILHVKKGVALTAQGDVLSLPEDEDITLTRTLEAQAGQEDLFRDCLAPPTASIPNGAGIYILVMSPASGYRERAPMSGLGDEGVIKGCGSRYIVEGVQFRLVELNPAHLDAITPETRDDLLLNDLLSFDNPANVTEPDRLSKLRNVIAHLCFGTEILKSFAADPFALENGDSTYINYSALDDLHQLELLTDCDVPLALFYWTFDGIAFLDLWSVRRRPYELTPSAQWPTLISPRRQAEAEAVFLQFQNHISELITVHLTLSKAALMEAFDFFQYLPPVGFLPLLEDNYRGVTIDAFFKRQPHRDQEFIGGEIITWLVYQSSIYKPISTSEREMIWIYKIWQHAKAINDGNHMQPYIIFTSGHVPYIAEAHFDVARWDYSNYTRL